VEGVEQVNYFTFLNANTENVVEWMCGHGGHSSPITSAGGGLNGGLNPPNLQWNWGDTFGNPDVAEAIKFIYYDEWEQLVQENPLTLVGGAGAGAGDDIGAGGAITGHNGANNNGTINPNARSHIAFIEAFRQLPVRMMRAGATFGTGQGTTMNALVDPNTGEFGALDDPFKYVNLHGAPQAYDSLNVGEKA